MQNIGVVCDTQWDNYILINNKFKKINPEHYRLHTLYGKTLEIFSNCCSSNSLTLIRSYSDNLSKTLYNLLKICDIWLIFTNYVEFNTQTRLMIEICDEYNIKYIIISECHRHCDYYSFEINHDLSFKKILALIPLNKSDNNIEEFNYPIYNDNFSRNVSLSLPLSAEIRSKIKDSYNIINKSRSDKCIKLLYDRDEMKKEKQIKKTIKEVSQLNFTKNRLNYYKNLN